MAEGGEIVFSSFEEIYAALIGFAPILIKVAIVLIVAFVVIKIIQLFIRGMLKKMQLNEDAELLLYKLSGYAMWFLVISWLVGELGFTEVFASLLALGALGGLAVSMAVKDSLSDAVSGLMLIKDRDFGLGDKIETLGNKGIIKDIGLRKTRVLLEDGTIAVLANSKIDSGGWKLLEKQKGKKKIMGKIDRISKLVNTEKIKKVLK